MGFFSWKTADTNESILIGRDKPVYLIQPNGLAPIEEEKYAGYGDFGGVDAYVWLAKMNLPELELRDLTNDELRDKGLDLEFMEYFVDEHGNKYASDPNVFQEKFKAVTRSITPFADYSSATHYGKTPNELIRSDQWKRVQLKDLLIDAGLFIPLKFSYNKDAIYEDLPYSKDCEKQGRESNSLFVDHETDNNVDVSVQPKR